jgi:hypothetical protein
LALKERTASSILLRCSLVMKKSAEAMCRWAMMRFISLKKQAGRRATFSPCRSTGGAHRSKSKPCYIWRF